MINLGHELLRAPIRISAFLRKEVAETLRQPRLILTLVLGPFLILLLFGIGYRDQPRSLRTLFVVSPENPFRQRLDEFDEDVSPLLNVVGVFDSLVEARERLRENQVDLVIEIPDDPVATIRNNHQAVFILHHNEIDPFQKDYVEVFGRAYVDEVNRRLLSDITERGQEETATFTRPVEEAQASARQMQEALAQGNVEEAREQQARLERGVGQLVLELGASTQLLDGVERIFGTPRESISSTLTTLTRIQANTDVLSTIPSGKENYDEEAKRVAVIEEDLTRLDTFLTDFTSIHPGILVSPFRSRTESVVQADLKLSDYYVPGVIALLAQHLAVTIAALSIVREQREGTMELFRVSPISALETLLGKYISFILFAAVIVAVLTALVVLVMDVPMLGSWTGYALIVLALVVTSLGGGFVISLAAETTSQAVQYAMIALLASIFFSGFFLSLDLLWQPVRVLSWLIPATYATQLLQDMMLRGTFARPGLLQGLTFMGTAFFVLAWLLLRLKMAKR